MKIQEKIELLGRIKEVISLIDTYENVKEKMKNPYVVEMIEIILIDLLNRKKSYLELSEEKNIINDGDIKINI